MGYVIIKPNETQPVLVTANNKSPRLTGSSEIKEFIQRSGVLTGEDPKPSSIDKYVPVPIGGGCSKIAVAVIVGLLLVSGVGVYVYMCHWNKEPQDEWAGLLDP